MKKSKPKIRIDWRIDGDSPWVSFGCSRTAKEALARVRFVRASYKAKAPEMRIAKYRECADGAYRWIVIIDNNDKYVGDNETEAKITRDA